MNEFTPEEVAALRELLKIAPQLESLVAPKMGFSFSDSDEPSDDDELGLAAEESLT